jgi:hypothetical protein
LTHPDRYRDDQNGAEHVEKRCSSTDLGDICLKRRNDSERWRDSTERLEDHARQSDGPSSQTRVPGRCLTEGYCIGHFANSFVLWPDER